MSDFELVSEIAPYFCPTVKLYKWRSKRTGLQAVLVKRQSPSVQGFFTVASEANDNSGCPHTLEHIVFMGSKSFPYKGLLDNLCSKQMSSSNAWTAQDHTCYTLTSAGYDGFFNLLPVYLDHILNATVKDSACLTEVYHIDGKAEEKGVVFSEMQGYEHTSSSLMIAEVQKMLFHANSGYATNTGGSLSALRLLKPDTIKQYHRDVYRPSNLSIAVAGDVEPQELLDIISNFNKDLPSLISSSGSSSNNSSTFTLPPRPFVESPLSTKPSPLKKNEIRTVHFPDSSEASGEMLISWLGPHISDVTSNTAIQVVLNYLTMRNTGKLEREYIIVDKDSALASEVGWDTNEYLYSQINLWFYGVPIMKFEDAADKVMQYLESKILEDLDLDFLKQSLDYVFDRFVLSAEEDVNTFVDLAICEFVYGDDKTTFPNWLGRTDEFDELRSWTEEHWREFITKYFVKSAKACVLGKPSRDEYIRIDEEKKKRLEHLKQTCDLEKKARELQQAIDENEKAIPEDVLAMFPSPDFTKIRFISSQTGATHRLLKHGLPGAPLEIDDSIQQYIEKDQCDMGLNFESFPSQFINIKLFISPKSVDQNLLPLISVLLANGFAFPMELDDGRKLTAEEVSQEVQRDLVSSIVDVDYQLQELVSISVKAKTKNYTKAIEWIQRLMFNVVFDEKNVSIFLARHLKNIPEAKRLDEALLSASVDEVLLNERSLRRQSDILISEEQVREFEQNIESTVASMKVLVAQLFRPENIRGVVVGDIPQIAKLNNDSVMKPWNSLYSRLLSGQRSTGLEPLTLPSEFRTEKGINPANEALVTICAASDSTNLKFITAGPQRYGDPDLPALSLVNALLDMPEGPFWKAVRGPGYAYGASLSTSVQMGHLILSLYSAADGLSAYRSCKAMVEDIVEGKYKIDAADLESAVATIVGDLAAHLAEPATAIEEKFADTVLKGYKPNYARIIIKELSEVTPTRFQSILKHYVLPLFSPESSAAFVVAPPSEGSAVSDGLRDFGYAVTVREVEVESDEEDVGSESEFEDGSEDESD